MLKYEILITSSKYQTINLKELVTLY